MHKAKMLKNYNNTGCDLSKEILGGGVGGSISKFQKRTGITYTDNVKKNP